ncbi:MAG: hypothetical protein PT977_06865 [Acidobacteriota bacterium]|nr:hypothetical protein [Acidobacteriota bacterium]
MNRLRFLAYAAVVPFAAALLAASPALGEGGAQKIERSFPFVGDKDIKVGLKVGDATIESFRIRHWPDADDFRKAEKDLNDTHTMVVEFRYSNRNRDNDYKVAKTVRVSFEIWKK